MNKGIDRTYVAGDAAVDCVLLAVLEAPIAAADDEVEKHWVYVVLWIALMAARAGDRSMVVK